MPRPMQEVRDDVRTNICEGLKMLADGGLNNDQRRRLVINTVESIKLLERTYA